jgi:hypothetical protein
MMEILIHTYGRHERQYTWDNLSPGVRDRTRLVVQAREQRLYDGYPIHVLPPEITCLSATRQYIFNSFEAEKICILDDDLDFAVRREDFPSRFRKAGDEDIDRLFAELEFYCGAEDGYGLVGVAAREGGNYQTGQFLYATRQMRVHAIDATLYRKLGIRFDRVAVMEDFDVTLQFLEAGYSNLVLNHWVTNQHGSNTAGGCSHYRTPEVQSASAHELARLHPGIVSVVRKATRVSWGGKPRDDVRIQWKKALEQGRARVLDPTEGKHTPEEGSVFTKAMD